MSDDGVLSFLGCLLVKGAVPDASGAIEIRAVKLIGGGRALAHADGATWMIRGGLPGEWLRVSPSRRRARIIEADVIEVLDDRHPARLEVSCPHARDCGGCDWPEVDPRRGADLKIAVAAEAAGRFPEIADRIRAASITDSPSGYRLRSRLHWDPSTRVLGFYGPRSWRVSSISHCGIISPTLAAALPSLSENLINHSLMPVDLEILEGIGATVAALRPGRGGPKSIPERCVPPAAECPGIDGFHRLTKSSLILPGWGLEQVSMDLPVPLEVPIGSFFQGNRHLVPWLFERVAGLVGPGDEPVVDLHAGVGFLAAAARWAGHEDLTVVEPHRPGAAAAQRNLPDARVVASSAEDFLERNRDLAPGAIAITDPPRTGLTAELRRRLIDWRPHRLLMLGCDPATWSRDAADLIDHGYVLSQIELVDLFPFTHHVEVLAVLESG
jgi:23S rRNA (uracil1939-C5)-methyltransferase